MDRKLHKTAEIFAFKDVKMNYELAKSHFEIATKCGLRSKVLRAKGIYMLDISGYRNQFIKFYTLALFKFPSKLENLKCLVKVIKDFD